MNNILYKIWRQERGERYQSLHGRLIDKRLVASESYSWGIPNEEALSELALYAPLIEIGAGLGYWARLLQDRQVSIIPTDVNPPAKGWTKVYPTTEAVYHHNRRSLFMCWIPEQEAQGIAELYEGSKVLWVGEQIRFPNFDQIKVVKIPQWSGYKDALFVFERRTYG